ncbi:MAG: hypothetical protein ACLSUZ_02750 [Bifidobacterium pseudocatenulatum]
MKNPSSCADQVYWISFASCGGVLFIAFYGFARAWVEFGCDRRPCSCSCCGAAQVGDWCVAQVDSESPVWSAYVLGLSGWQTFVTVICRKRCVILPASVIWRHESLKTSLAVLLGHPSGPTDHRREPFQCPTGTCGSTGDFLQ